MQIRECFLHVDNRLPRVKYLLVCYPSVFRFSPSIVQMLSHRTIRQIKLVATDVDILYDLEKKRSPRKFFFDFRATLRQNIHEMFQPGFDSSEFE